MDLQINQVKCTIKAELQLKWKSSFKRRKKIKNLTFNGSDNRPSDQGETANGQTHETNIFPYESEWAVLVPSTFEAAVAIIRHCDASLKPKPYLNIVNYDFLLLSNLAYL